MTSDVSRTFAGSTKRGGLASRIAVLMFAEGDTLDERRHDARSVTNGQLETICCGSFAVSRTVVWQPGQRQTDKNIQTRSDKEAAVTLLGSVCSYLLLKSIIESHAPKVMYSSRRLRY